MFTSPMPDDDFAYQSVCFIYLLFILTLGGDPRLSGSTPGPIPDWRHCEGAPGQDTLHYSHKKLNCINECR